MKRSLYVLLSLSVIAGMLAVTGCGSKKTSTTSPSAATPPTTSAAPAGGGANLNLSADPGGAPAFDTSTLSAKAGSVTITMSNPSSTPHAIAIEGNGVDKDGTGGTSGVSQGQTSTVTVKLKAGTYEFYCPVDGHKAAGMKGTLTVK